MNTKTNPTISKVGQRRQVVIPKDICDELGLMEGGFIEVSSERGTVVIKPKRLVDQDTLLTTPEARSVRKGLTQLQHGQTKPWQQVKDGLDD